MNKAPIFNSDPVFLQIFWSRVQAIANEAAQLIIRTSFSTLSSEANDFAVVITDGDGHAFAENSGSLPSFIGTLPNTVQATISKIGKDNMVKGDVFITNNPWVGTGHLNDVCLVKPIFYQDTIVGFAATAGHVPDIGGKIRSVDARELYEEGFHIPIMPLVKGGVQDLTLIQLIRTNVRTPDQTVGDIFCHVGAVELIQKRIHELLAEYKLNSFSELAKNLFELSDQAMRKAIRSLPEGNYSYTMETDGFHERFQFHVNIEIKDSQIACDFSGSPSQQNFAINCVLPYTNAMVIYTIKSLLLPNLSNNYGLFKAITTTAPEGSILNPKPPAPVGGRSCTGHYVPCLIFGALASILEKKVMAASGSPVWIANLNGIKEDGKPFACVLFFNGGLGATALKDGSSVMSWPSNISPTPIEIAERDFPLFFNRKSLLSDSGGAGLHRGGLGEEISFINKHAFPLSIVFLTERLIISAPGIAGGESGKLGAVYINGKIIDSRKPHILLPGDEVLLRTPGGGGYGKKNQRNTDLIDFDLQHGYVSSEA
jgi:N-methylhydantoinase B